MAIKRKQCLALIVAFFVLAGVFAPISWAQVGFTAEINHEGTRVTVQGETSPDTFVSIMATRKIDGSLFFTDQTRSDAQGNYAFSFLLEGGDYRIVEASNGQYNYQDLSIKTADTRTVTVRVEGSAENLLPLTKVSILSKETTLLEAVEQALDDGGVDYIISNGMITSIAGEESWQWMVDNRGGMHLPTTALTGGEEIVLIDDMIWDPVITRLVLDNTEVKVGDEFTATLEAYSNGSYSALEGKPILFSNKVYQTDAEGKVKLIAGYAGEHTVRSEPVGSYIRPIPVKVVAKTGGSTPVEDEEVSVYIEIQGYQHTVLLQRRVTTGIFSLDSYLGPPDGSSATPSTGWDTDKFTQPTVAHATIKALEEAGFSKGEGRGHYDFQDYGWSCYMAMIDGERERDYVNTSGWMVKVNDRLIPVGSQAYYIKDDDKIYWYFSLNGFDDTKTRNPAFLLAGEKTSDDTELEENLSKTGQAKINLDNKDEAKAILSPDIIMNINNELPIILENKDIRVEFPAQAFLTEEFARLTSGGETKIELGVKELNAAEKQDILNKAQLGENTGIIEIGGKIIEFTAEVVSSAEDGAITREKITGFGEPLKITLDLSGANITEEDIANLCAVRYVPDEEGNMTLVKLGGSYDPQTKQFTFYTDSFSYYGIVKVTDLIKINLGIDMLSVQVNGEKKYLDVPATLLNSRTMVPLRFVAEALKTEVEWVEASRSVVITQGGKVLNLPVDQPIPGLDVTATIQGGRTLVPIRYVSENLGAHVMWHPSGRRVEIVK